MGVPILSFAAKLGEPSVIEARPSARYHRPVLRERKSLSVSHRKNGRRPHKFKSMRGEERALPSLPHKH